MNRRHAAVAPPPTSPVRQHDAIDLAFGLFMGTMTAVSGWLWFGTGAWPFGALLIAMGASVDVGAIVAWRRERS